VDRFDDLLRAYGVPVEPYYRAVIDYAWTSQGARALHPGYQADAMIVLFSDKQGTGKTQSILAIAPKIGGLDTYMNIHIDELLTAERAARVLKGCLIANLDELRDIGSKREAAEVKAAISRTKEAFVPKYKETRDEFGRQCVIYATTNKKKFLDDSTGNRRYHILPVGDIDLDWIAANAEQLWAQGVATFKAQGQLWKRALELAVDHITEYEIDDLWEGAIAAWLEATPLEGFTTSDVLTHAINVPIERQGRRESTRVGTILKQLGYEARQFRVDGKRHRGYFPVTAADIDW
jgi:predicted P-loop ATPase